MYPWKVTIPNSFIVFVMLSLPVFYWITKSQLIKWNLWKNSRENILITFPSCTQWRYKEVVIFRIVIFGVPFWYFFLHSFTTLNLYWLIEIYIEAAGIMFTDEMNNFHLIGFTQKVYSDFPNDTNKFIKINNENFTENTNVYTRVDQ